MAVMKTHISWTDSTWNPTVGCTKISAGCDNCYAEAIVNRYGGDFSKIIEHPRRLQHVKQFQPIPDGPGFRPRLVFVNSMSDLLHEDISESFRDLVFNAIDEHRQTVFQVLTKRASGLHSYIRHRYTKAGVPPHLWLGVSVEDDVVKGRIRILRKLKEKVGSFTAFLSIEPLIGPIPSHDYTAIDWVLIGGESMQRGRWRPMEVAWARSARDKAREVGAAIWFKQFGMWPNNPLFQQAPGDLKFHAKIAWAIAHGEREARLEWNNGKVGVVGEKGGATLDGEVLHELPKSYAELKRQLHRSLV